MNQKTRATSKAAGVVRIALCVAIMAVSAWISIPLGPIPFTLQMFAMTFAIIVLEPKHAMAAIACYLIAGAIGLPVFSGMRGGIGVIMGPTGGFLWGYLPGFAAGLAIVYAGRKRRAGSDNSKAQAALSILGKADVSVSEKVRHVAAAFGIDIAAGLAFTAIAYICGLLHYMVVMNVSAEAAFVTCCAPFIFVDVVKIVFAVICAEAVLGALRKA